MVEVLTSREKYLDGILRNLNRRQTKRNRAILDSEIMAFNGDKDYAPHGSEQMYQYFSVNGTKGILD
jgi:hypothetical protein